MSRAESVAFEFGPYRISTSDRLLLRSGKVIPLAPKAIETLLALVSNPGRVVTKEELITKVWPNTFVEEGSLARNISLLRKVFEDGTGDGHDGHYIETVAKRGYRWIGPVAEEQSGNAVDSIAVLPIEDLSRDSEPKYFTAGMTEALLISLGRVGALKVIAYSGSRTAESPSGPVEIARQLGAAAFLTGSALREGDRVRVMVRLVLVRSGEQIWADQYDGTLKDVLEFQSNVGRNVADAVQVKLTSRERRRLAAHRAVVPAAYHEYLKGRYHWNRRAPESFRKAMEHFRQAIHVDPTWSPPYAGLADAYSLLGSTRYDVTPPREAMPKAKAAAVTALELDEQSAEANTSLAYVLFGYDWDWSSAEHHFRRALELNPGYPTAHHWYGHFLLARGRLEEGIARMHAALERDPLSLAINIGVGWSLYLAGRYGDAIRQYKKALDMEANFVLGRCLLGMAYEREARFAEAIAEFRAALDLTPHSTLALGRLAQTCAVSGNLHDAQEILKLLLQLTETMYVPSVYLAAVCLALGYGDQAFAWMEKAYEERAHQLVYLNVEPSLESLRTDSRFADVARRIGLG